MPSHVRYGKKSVLTIKSYYHYFDEVQITGGTDMISSFSDKTDTVLIVDDTIGNHEVLQSFLNDIGVKCESAFDGMEAITRCTSSDSSYYSLILMDINLPGMDGIQTAKKLKNAGIASPIIAVTAASSGESMIKEAKEHGIFDMILFKPFNASGFYTALSPYIKQTFLHSLSPETQTGDEDPYAAMDSDVCDVHAAIENMGNNARLFRKHFGNFKNNNVDLALRLSTMVEAERFSDASMLCHSIKGLAGMLGLNGLYNHLIMLEKPLKLRQEETADRCDTDSEIRRLILCIGNDIRLICQIQF